MPATQHFRSAFNGFNREDVVNYIEYLNNHYAAQLAQLNNQLQEMGETVSADTVAELQSRLHAALLRCAELEEKLHAQESKISAELEAYRRAEEVERMAHIRAQEIYGKARATLAEATAMAEAAAEEFNQVAERTEEQLKEYQTSIFATVSSFRSAASALNCVDSE